MNGYPLNNCLATVKSKVVRETDRWKHASEEKRDDLYAARYLRTPSPSHHLTSSPGSSPNSPPQANSAQLKGMKQHLRTLYDHFGDEAAWDDHVVRRVSGVLRAIGEIYWKSSKNQHEGLLYLRASWELKHTSTMNFPDKQVINNLYSIANIHKELDEPKMARLAYLEILPLMERTYGFDHEDTAEIRRKMSQISFEQNKWRLPWKLF